MQNQYDPRTTSRIDPAVTVGVPSATRDAGLRSYMLKVYNYMASGVLLTGIVALLFANSPFFSMAYRTVETARGQSVQPTILGWIITFAPLIFIFMFRRVTTGSLASAQAIFWSFATVMGLSMSTIFAIYTGASIAQTFFAVSAAFLGLSLYGYTTKKDLSGFGTFLIMGVVGLIVAMVINMFLQSTAMGFAISAIGVLLFAGLTAYDTQKIKSMYAHIAGSDMVGKAAIMSALTLYLDFINMFQFMLSFMGDRR